MLEFMGTAEVFLSGHDQTVRLPHDCRFEGNEVEVWREEHAVILTPVRALTWPIGYFERLGRVTDDFGASDMHVD